MPAPGCQVKHLPCLLQVASLSISLLGISLHLVTNLLALHDLILLLSLLLSVVTGVSFGHDVMLLKVLFESISNLLLDLRLLISGHCLSVLNQGILDISGLGLHVDPIQGIAKHTRLHPAQLQQGFSIIEVGFSTISSHLALVLGHNLTSLGAVGDRIRDSMHQQVTLALSQQLLGMLKALRGDNHSRHDIDCRYE